MLVPYSQQQYIKYMDRDFSVYQCTFHAYIQKATVLIKFPCTYFLQWKTGNGKKSVQGKVKASALQNQVTFKQTIQLTTEMLFDKRTKSFIKKESLLNLNLISKSRKEHVKLVGRVTVDLAEMANEGAFQKLESHKLSYCSVEGDLKFQACIQSRRQTNLNAYDFDKTSFSEYLSCHTYTQKQSPKQGNMDSQQENSIELFKRAQNVQSNQGQSHRHQGKQSNQTFFILPSSPPQHEMNRTGRYDRGRSNDIQTVCKLPKKDKSWRNFREVGTNQGSKEQFMQNRNLLRDEIDGNRHKIQDLQRKIFELCANLQDSKRLVQVNEKANQQKQKTINQLKRSTERLKQNDAAKQVQHKYQRILQEKREEISRLKALEEGFKQQLSQANAYNHNQRRETEQFRQIWTQKKQHFQEKLKSIEQVVRQKQGIIELKNVEVQSLTKYKYQYELVKQLSEQKQAKVKKVERDFEALLRQLDDIKSNNLGQENYKLKIEYNQLLKNMEELGERHGRCEDEISRYKNNYIKIQTAYEIQSKNYENSKEKNKQLENKFAEMQEQSIENKTSLKNLRKQFQQLQLQWDIGRKAAEEGSLMSEKVKQIQIEKKALLQQRDELKSQIVKLGLQHKSALQEFKNQIHRVGEVFTFNSQLKEKAFAGEKKVLTDQKVSLEKSLQQLASQLALEITKFDQEREGYLSQICILKQQMQFVRQQKESLKVLNSELTSTVSQLKMGQSELLETVAILEEESQKIIDILEQKEGLEKEIEDIKDSYYRQERQAKEMREITERARQEVQWLQKRNEQMQNFLQLKISELHSKDQLLQQTHNNLQSQSQEYEQYKIYMRNMQLQIVRHKEIIEEIKQTNQQHLQSEQRFNQQIHTLRQQQQKNQLLMNHNTNQLVIQNQELQDRIQSMKQQLQKLVQVTQPKESEKNHLEELASSVSEAKLRKEEAETKIGELESCIDEKVKTIGELESCIDEKVKTIGELSRQMQQIKSRDNELEDKIRLCEEWLNQKNEEIHTLSMGNLSFHEDLSLKKKNQQFLRQRINNLERDLLNHHEEKHQRSQKYSQLQNILLQSQRKNEKLEERLSTLLVQIEQSKQKKPREGLREVVCGNFPRFQLEQMNKIINEQRTQIQKLEKELQRREIGGCQLLQKRIGELQCHMVEMQSSFRQQIQRLVSEQGGRGEDIKMGSLDIIRQQVNDDSLYKSERSLLNSLSRVKSSIELAEVNDLKERLGHLQQEKRKLQEQFITVEQQKFNLLSTIHQKDIQIEDLKSTIMHLHRQIQQIADFNGEFKLTINNLESQVEQLKNRLTFGSQVITPYSYAVTRSEPLLFEDSRLLQNKDVEIECLRAEVEKQRNREEELIWDIKDLQLQLQTVTESLNNLNASSMNSVLNSSKHIRSEKEIEHSEKRKEESHDKETLLQNLKKNQDLKELSHNLIRVLKQKQKDSKQQEELIKNLQRRPHQTTEPILKDTSKPIILSLVQQFQNIKLLVIRAEGKKLEGQSQFSQQHKILRSVLTFEAKLKQIKLNSESQLLFGN